MGTPHLSYGILGNVAKHYGIWVPPCGQTDVWMDGQTRVKTLPSRRTTYAGGKYVKLYTKHFYFVSKGFVHNYGHDLIQPHNILIQIIHVTIQIHTIMVIHKK